MRRGKKWCWWSDEKGEKLRAGLGRGDTKPRQSKTEKDGRQRVRVDRLVIWEKQSAHGSTGSDREEREQKENRKDRV